MPIYWRDVGKSEAFSCHKKSIKIRRHNEKNPCKSAKSVPYVCHPALTRKIQRTNHYLCKHETPTLSTHHLLFAKQFTNCPNRPNHESNHHLRAIPRKRNPYLRASHCLFLSVSGKFPNHPYPSNRHDRFGVSFALSDAESR